MTEIKYNSDIPKKLINYFKKNSLVRIKKTKNNKTYIPVPTLKNFAQTIKVTMRTLQEWANNHLEFAAAKATALEIQRDSFSNIDCIYGFNWSGNIKYNDEIPALLIDYFLEIFINSPNRLPTSESFAVKIGASRQSIYRWSDKHSEFKTALEFCKTLQHAWLLDAISSGKITNSTGIFLLKCLHGVKEKSAAEEIPDTPVLTFDDVLGICEISDTED